MSFLKAEFLVITGAHDALRRQVAGVMNMGGMWGKTDFIAHDGIGPALADTGHSYHEAALGQIETALRLHWPKRESPNPPQIVMVGPTDWARMYKTGNMPDRGEVTAKMMEAQRNISAAFPELGRLRPPMVLNYESLRAASMHPVKRMVLGCIDLRYIHRLMTAIDELFGGAHLGALAGATGAVTNDKTQAMVLELPEILEAEAITLVPHWDCGAFGGAGKCPRSHHRRHRVEAQGAVAAIRSRFPAIQIDCRLLDLQRGLVPIPGL